jgi:hypothetical protein
VKTLQLACVMLFALVTGVFWGIRGAMLAESPPWSRQQEDIMLMIREIMYCKPGKVRPMVEKFVAMSEVMAKNGPGRCA